MTENLLFSKLDVRIPILSWKQNLVVMYKIQLHSCVQFSFMSTKLGFAINERTQRTDSGFLKDQYFL